jgi:hypothetical protein
MSGFLPGWRITGIAAATAGQALGGTKPGVYATTAKFGLLLLAHHHGRSTPPKIYIYGTFLQAVKGVGLDPTYFDTWEAAPSRAEPRSQTQAATARRKHASAQRKATAPAGPAGSPSPAAHQHYSQAQGSAPATGTGSAGSTLAISPWPTAYTAPPTYADWGASAAQAPVTLETTAVKAEQLSEAEDVMDEDDITMDSRSPAEIAALEVWEDNKEKLNFHYSSLLKVLKKDGVTPLDRC